jgi:predicted short-subunit dehydrogenase-like oxidoreductase (DUF2520 family)
LTSFRLIGPGRAGRSLATALSNAGWGLAGILGRHDDLRFAAGGVDVLVIATPDDAVARVSAAVEPSPTAVVLHLAGSLGLDVLDSHPRRASVHPLVTLPEPGVGAARLAAGAFFAVAGDPLAFDLVAALGGQPLAVPDAARATYHAAACLAANHVVALLGQVERVAADAGVPLAAFMALARGALDDVAAVGPARALTGPVARGDRTTVERHRAVLDPAERPAYDALVELSQRLVQERAAEDGRRRGRGPRRSEEGGDGAPPGAAKPPAEGLAACR